MTQVVVQSYSDVESVTPQSASIYIKTSDVSLTNTKTLFTILKDTNLRLASILKTDQMATDEISNSKFAFNKI